MQEFVRLVGRKFGERHVVRHSGVVDEDADGLCRARLDTGVSAKISGHGTHPDIGEYGHEFFEPAAAPAYDQKVVSLGTEALGEGPADA